MGSTSKLDLLRQANSKIIALAQSTADGRAAGLIGERDEFVAKIRKVTAKETAQALGRVPRLLARLRDKRDDETALEFDRRMAQEALDDPELFTDMVRQTAENVRGLAALGVVAIGVRRENGELELEDVALQLDGDLTPERLLGADLDAVADEVTLWSSGHRSAEADAVAGHDGRRVGGADQIAQFPAERPGDPAQPPSADDGPEPDAVP